MRMASKRPRENHFTYRLLYLLMAIGLLHMVFLSGLEVYRQVQATSQIRTLKQGNTLLLLRTKALRNELAHDNDPRFLSDLARRLGYVGKNEVLVPNRALPAPKPPRPTSGP